MSGAFLTARSPNPYGDLSVCNQLLPVFDGKARFDLVLKPKKAVMVHNASPGNYSGPAVICRVKFIPIAGYQPDNPGIKLMRQTDEIEVWLMPRQGDPYVRALSDCVADARGLWHRRGHIDTGCRAEACQPQLSARAIRTRC